MDDSQKLDISSWPTDFFQEFCERNPIFLSEPFLFHEFDIFKFEDTFYLESKATVKKWISYANDPEIPLVTLRFPANFKNYLNLSFQYHLGNEENWKSYAHIATIFGKACERFIYDINDQWKINLQDDSHDWIKLFISLRDAGMLKEYPGDFFWHARQSNYYHSDYCLFGINKHGCAFIPKNLLGSKEPPWIIETKQHSKESIWIKFVDQFDFLLKTVDCGSIVFDLSQKTDKVEFTASILDSMPYRPSILKITDTISLEPERNGWKFVETETESPRP